MSRAGLVALSILACAPPRLRATLALPCHPARAGRDGAAGGGVVPQHREGMTRPMP